MKVPRLSEHYLFHAEYFWAMGNEHSAWFYLMSAWFYEDEDEQLAKGTQHEWTKENRGWAIHPSERCSSERGADPCEIPAQAA